MYKIIHVVLLISILTGYSPINGYAKNVPNGTSSVEIAFFYGPTTILISQIDTNEADLQKIAQDTSIIDSLTQDVKKPRKKESSFKSKVKYHANDSIMIDNQNNKAYLWGDAWVEYEDIKLDADYLEIDFTKNEVFAKGLPDSTGRIVDTPVFKEKGKEYKSGQMTYNFESKKGLIKKITTQEASGYIHGETVKMASQDVFYIKNGRYTTCNLDHPHYYVKSNKLKIINNDKIVTGPAYLAIEDVPTFLATPFGFFPNQDERTSGVLIPSFGSSVSKGFALNNGGYYFGISDQYDLSLTGDVYTNGSWSGRARGNYKTRYKRSGSLQLNYTNNKTGEKGEEDFTIAKGFFVNWHHSQDPKAKPNSNFTASVNVGSSDYYQNDLNVSDQNFLRNEFSSNITYHQKFGRSPFSASLNASHNQNNVDSTLNFVLPEVNVNMARVFPFKRKVKVGRDKWYEKVGLNYNGAFKNEVRTKTNQLFKDQDNYDPSYQAVINNGVKHSVNTSTSLKMGHFNLSPGINYNETWYFKAVDQAFDPTLIITERPPNDNGDIIYDTTFGQVVKDTTNGFNRFGFLNLNASMSTKLYGMFAFRGKNLKAIRHTITPQVGFSYQPNLRELRPEYFGETETDTAGTTKGYTLYDGGIYGIPNGNEVGNLTFRVDNIIEMKRKKRSDTTDTFKNVKLIDRWNFNTSYNMLADSFNWAPMQMNVSGRIGKFVNLTANTTSDFYGVKYDSETGKATSRSTEFSYNQTGKILRLTQFRTSVGLRLAGSSKSSEKEQTEIKQMNPNDPNAIYEETRYVDFNIPWNVTANYVMTYNKPLDEENIINTLNFSGSINLTPGWKIMLRSSFDFKKEQLGYTTVNIYRDLHCWQIDMNLIPFGSRKSFMVNIKVKQGFLQDLKLSKNSRWFD